MLSPHSHPIPQSAIRTPTQPCSLRWRWSRRAMTRWMRSCRWSWRSPRGSWGHCSWAWMESSRGRRWSGGAVCPCGCVCTLLSVEQEGPAGVVGSLFLGINGPPSLHGTCVSRDHKLCAGGDRMHVRIQSYTHTHTQLRQGGGGQAWLPRPAGAPSAPCHALQEGSGGETGQCG